jgi:dTDP-4-amino-4,6-dideoxygalactose transaminase
MVDLFSQYEKLKPQIDQAIQEVINTSSFINGQSVKEFSNNLAEYLDCAKVVPCANGTDALQIALMTLGLEEGDEVILPGFTYVATAEVMALLKLKPIFVDVYEDSLNIDIDALLSKITPRTKAVVPVHLYGQCADMEAILEIAKKHNLFVIEDTAQALGASFTFSNGTVKKAGTMGHVGCTSFFPSKNLGCFGDGGAMIFNEEKLAEKARMIANHGQSIKYHHDMVGCNSRLDSLQAAILNIKLPSLDSYCNARQLVAKNYSNAFRNSSSITLPDESSFSTHVYHQYTIKTAGIDRDTLKNKLQDKGVPSMIYYPVPLHHQKAYFNDQIKLPISEMLSKSVLSLPIHTEMDSDTQAYIIDSVLKSIEEIRS